MSQEKTSTFYLKKLCQKLTDFNDFWHVKFWEDLTWNVTDLSRSPVRCSHFTLGNLKKSFSAVLFMHNCDYLCYLRRKNCNPLAHPAWKYHHTNLWIAKLFRLTEGLLRSFKTLEAVKRASCGLSSVALKPVVTCGNWNVWQAVSQQVFRLTTFCVNTCFQSFSTLISRIVNHTVLKFSPCGNKPLPQASTCPYQYTRSSCSVLQTQY